MPAVPATHEVEVGGSGVWGQPGQSYWEPTSQTKYKQKRQGINQVVECLPSVCGTPWVQSLVTHTHRAIITTLKLK
jgi:hypothetical protein